MLHFYHPYRPLHRRWLSLYEYQAAKLMKEYGIPIANGVLSRTPKDVETAFTQNSIIHELL